MFCASLYELASQMLYTNTTPSAHSKRSRDFTISALLSDGSSMTSLSSSPVKSHSDSSDDDVDEDDTDSKRAPSL